MRSPCLLTTCFHHQRDPSSPCQWNMFRTSGLCWKMYTTMFVNACGERQKSRKGNMIPGWYCTPMKLWTIKEGSSLLEPKQCVILNGCGPELPFLRTPGIDPEIENYQPHIICISYFGTKYFRSGGQC